jgi:Xaa-Pro aminopeptidase
MSYNVQRLDLNAAAIRGTGWSGMLCSSPSNVLLLTGGYWPVVGTSLALATAAGRVAAIVPEDESELAHCNGRAQIFTFKAASLDALTTAAGAIWTTLATAAAELKLLPGILGCDIGEDYEPASYASMHHFKSTLSSLATQALPDCVIAAADPELAKLRSVYTDAEVDQIRKACEAARLAFETARTELQPGVSEIAAAARARFPLYIPAGGRDPQHLAIMSGPRSAAAFGAYALSSDRRLSDGELAMVHCNSNVGGYWTDITRTFCLGQPSESQRKMYEAVHAARAAALHAIRPGIHGSEVDRAARDVLCRHGFGKAFKHPTGHGVGFSAINHNARPRLHPQSQDILLEGMIFNVEPAIYLEGEQGLRNCDMVQVTAEGAELLTPFMQNIDELILGG